MVTMRVPFNVILMLATVLVVTMVQPSAVGTGTGPDTESQALLERVVGAQRWAVSQDSMSVTFVDPSNPRSGGRLTIDNLTGRVGIDNGRFGGTTSEVHTGGAHYFVRIHRTRLNRHVLAQLGRSDVRYVRVPEDPQFAFILWLAQPNWCLAELSLTLSGGQHPVDVTSLPTGEVVYTIDGTTFTFLGEALVQVNSERERRTYTYGHVSVDLPERDRWITGNRLQRALDRERATGLG